MANEIMKLIILFVICIGYLRAADEVTESSTEYDLLCDENNTCTSLSTEIDNTTDFYTTELYTNETINDTILSLKPKDPRIDYDKQSSSNEDYCLCDLQLDYCDINCCCDTNCTYEQKLIFSNCESTPIYDDPHYCYASHVLFINNTKVYMELPEQRLFCIIRSNLPSYSIEQLSTPIKSITQVEYLTSKRYKWPKSMPNVSPDKLNTEYKSVKYGDNIWLQVADEDFVHLMLPDKFSSSICAQNKPIRFLIDFTSTCSQIIINDKNYALNAENYYKNISILSKPKTLNSTITNHECPKNNCLSFNVFLCDESLVECAILKNDTNIKLNCHFSTFRNEQSCSFVTKKVKYHFFHNISNELTTANLYLFVTNITYFMGDPFELVQHFEVKYFWEGYKENFTSILSGNPGYLLGKHILFGDLITNNTNNTKEKYSIHRHNTDFSKNFLVFPKNKKGFCVLNNYTYLPVQFGYNFQSNCIYQHKLNMSNNATTLCTFLQKDIFLMWQINITRNYEGSGKYIGMFGNANHLKLSEWIEIYYKFNGGKILEHIIGELNDNELVCRNVAHALSVNIYYVHVDFKFTKFQSKILNVVFDIEQSDYLKFQYNNKEHLIDTPINTKVMFHDITQSKVKNFAKPPNLQFTLPHDFFYPFMMGNQNIVQHNCKLMFTFCILVIYFYW